MARKKEKKILHFQIPQYMMENKNPEDAELVQIMFEAMKERFPDKEIIFSPFIPSVSNDSGKTWNNFDLNNIENFKEFIKNLGIDFPE